MFALAEVNMFYTASSKVYVGQQPGRCFQISSIDVVDPLFEPIYDAGRHLSIDNWFNTIELVAKYTRRK